MEQQNRLEMKLVALKEGFKNQVADLTERYEDRIADLRIELTEYAQQLQETQLQLQQANERIREFEENALEKKEEPADAE
jgi:hypothetical protein